MENKSSFGFVGFIVCIVLVLILAFSSFGTISAGERGVKTRFGAIVGVVDTGLYFKRPFTDSVHKMSVKTLTVSFDNQQASGDNTESSSLFSASKDLQDVQIATVVTYHIDATKVDQIYQQYSSVDNFQANVIEPMIREVVKSTSAGYTAEELVTKRAEFSDKVTAILETGFAGKSAILEKFSVTNFEFSKSFNDAIEAKVTAEQNAEAAKNKLAQIQYEAEQKVTTAKADAEAISIQAQAINSQGGEDYVKLKAVYQWDGHGCVSNCYSGTPNMPVPFLNLGK